MYGYYYVADHGDGSVGVRFFKTKEDAEISYKLHTDSLGYEFCEGGVKSLSEKDFN